MQFPGGGHDPYLFFLAEQPGDAFFLLSYGAYPCRPFCHFGQLGGKQAVALVPVVEVLHDAQQVCFLLRQQVPQGIYLSGVHIFPAVGLQRLQQAVRQQPVATVVAIVRLFPCHYALTPDGKPRDAAVCLVDVKAHRADFYRFRFYLTQPFPLMQQSGGHASYDRHQYHVSEKDFMLQ